MKPIVVLSGGGVKSAACAARIADEHELILLHIDFGDPAAAAQFDSLQALASCFPAASVVQTKLAHFHDFDSARGDGQKAAGRSGAAAEAGPPRAARLGLFPVLASLAVQCAIRRGARRIVTGLSERADASHLGLHLSPDRPDQIHEWLYSFNAMAEASLPEREPIVLDAPLLEVTYTEIVKLAFHFQTPFEHTSTCDRAGPRPCGRCPSCQTRGAAFSEARLVDPLVEVVAT